MDKIKHKPEYIVQYQDFFGDWHRVQSFHTKKQALSHMQKQINKYILLKDIKYIIVKTERVY